MVRKVALTGATGFVGGAVLPLLLKAGYEVSVLVRQPKAGQFSNKVRIVVGDLGNPKALADLVDGADCVIHVAGAISALSREQLFKTNLEGVQAVFAAAETAGVGRFIHISSLAARLPALSPYAASKRAGEEFLQAVKSTMSITLLRPSAIYGPGDKATLPLLAALQNPIALIPGSAAARFSLLHVRDFASVIVAAVTRDAAGLFEIDDMSGGHNWAELSALNVQSSGLPKRIVYLPRWLLSAVAILVEAVSFITQKPGMITRAKLRELYHEDWVVQGPEWPRPHPIGLAEGLGETLEWYRSHGWLRPLTTT